MSFKRALISVSDKTGLWELADALVKSGYSIVASDGTAAKLSSLGLPVERIEEITSYPELFSGRVKTLHPLIHGALLFDREDPAQVREAESAGITPIDIVVVNLYSPEKFDIGGPTLIRAAAKNWRSVSVITDPDQYPELITSLELGVTDAQRKAWSLAALEVTARYDLSLLEFLGEPLRYGENPHQSATLVGGRGVAGAKLIQGKKPSFNNYRDAQVALRIAHDHELPTFVIVKHGIPSGIASDIDPARAFAAALAADPVSAFGGVVATRNCVSEEIATLLTDSFFEVIVAPEFTDAAIEKLKAKPNLRVLEVRTNFDAHSEIHQIDGGFLFQQPDALIDSSKEWKHVSGAPATSAQLQDLEFAWRCVARTRSNAIVIAKDKKTLGIGAGEVNRVAAVKSALDRAGASVSGAVAAGDGFFPFPDGLELLINSGISAVVAPGGSIRDGEVIATAQAAGLTLYLSGFRHFSHN